MRPVKGFELYAWVFMRLSGVLLLFLALGHLTIMHLIHSVEEVSYDFVAERFTTPYWRTYDWLMLTLAMTHGVNGMRTIIKDYVHRPALRTFALYGLYIVGALLFVIGTWVLVAFQPEVGLSAPAVTEMVP